MVGGLLHHGGEAVTSPQEPLPDPVADEHVEEVLPVLRAGKAPQRGSQAPLLPGSPDLSWEPLPTGPRPAVLETAHDPGDQVPSAEEAMEAWRRARAALRRAIDDLELVEHHLRADLPRKGSQRPSKKYRRFAEDVAEIRDALDGTITGFGPNLMRLLSDGNIRERKLREQGGEGV